MQATRPVDLIFQRTITQFSQATEEKLASQRVQRFPFIQPDEMRRRSDSSRKYCNKNAVRSSLPSSVSARAT